MSLTIFSEFFIDYRHFPTCLHRRTASGNEPKKQHKKIDIDGKKYTRYECTQLQRQIETKIRKLKDRKEILKAAGDDVGVRECNRKIRLLKEKYNEITQKAGLDAHYDRMSVVKSGKTVDFAAKSDIINTREFHTSNDPLKEVFGSAEQSNPKEIQILEKHLNDIGVTLVREKHEKLSYSPGLSMGQPGTVYISENASYGAWLHEIKHADDDMKDGWLGMRVFQDPKKCIQRETDAYQLEIDLAESVGRKDIVKRLEVLRDNEISQYE